MSGLYNDPKGWGAFTPGSLLRCIQGISMAGGYVRPIPYFRLLDRLRQAWDILTCRADALYWPYNYTLTGDAMSEKLSEQYDHLWRTAHNVADKNETHSPGDADFIRDQIAEVRKHLDDKAALEQQLQTAQQLAAARAETISLLKERINLLGYHDV